MINSMYNHNGNDITKNKPVHVIMVLIEYVNIGDSSVNSKSMQSRVMVHALCMSPYRA